MADPVDRFCVTLLDVKVIFPDAPLLAVLVNLTKIVVEVTIPEL